MSQKNTKNGMATAATFGLAGLIGLMHLQSDDYSSKYDLLRNLPRRGREVVIYHHSGYCPRENIEAGLYVALAAGIVGFSYCGLRKLFGDKD
jgi:hypothetical protein